MELKELCEKVQKILKTKEMDDIGDALFNACHSDEMMNSYVAEIGELETDQLQKIFQYYQAERKEKKQDYTPKSLARFVGKLLGDADVVYDYCAGSGALTIQRWSMNHNQKFVLFEFDEKVIPYLIFNMCIRNIECEINHSDVLTQETFMRFRISKGEKFGKLEVVQ